MAIVLGNRAKMSTSTTGTGTITLGSASTGYQTFDAAGITNGQTVRYAIEDGSNFEIGSGTYTTSGTTLTRTVTESNNSDNAITLSGTALVFITATAADLFVNDGANSLTTTGVITGGTVEATSDTAAGDNAAMGFTSAEGLILTGQGSTNDVTIKNDADAIAMRIPTGTTGVTFASVIAVNNVDIATGAISLKNSGAQSYIRFYCESNNEHYAQLQAPAHGLFSGNVTLTLPATTDTVAGIAATQTFTNKTLTSPVLNTGSVGTSLTFPDNAKALFGTGSDLKIFHDGSNSFIFDEGTGDLNVKTNGGDIRFETVDAETVALFNKDGAVELYFNNSKKIESTATGISVTGNVIASGTVEPAGDTAAGDNAAIGYTAAEGLILTGQGSTSDITLKNDADAVVFTVPTGTDDILFPDGAKAMFGAGTDLQISHNGSNSLIADVGTGDLQISGQNVGIFSNAGEPMFVGVANGQAELYHNNVKRLETTATSVSITGNVIASGTVEPAGDTAAGDNAAVGYTAAEGLILTGQGSTNDVTIKNDADADVLEIPTGTTNVAVVGSITSGGAAVKVAGLETIWVPATAMYPATTNGSSALTQVETTALRPDLMVLDFAAAADDFAQFSIGFPKSWNEGTVKFQVFWTPSSTNTDNCIWGLQGVSVADGATIDVVYGTAITVTDAGIGTVEDQQVSPVSGAVTITNAAVDTQTYFQIFRDGNAGGDTFSGVSRLLGIKLFFTTDAANDA